MWITVSRKKSIRPGNDPATVTDQRGLHHPGPGRRWSLHRGLLCALEEEERDVVAMIVFLLSDQGQNRLFMSHLLLRNYGEDDEVRAWRSVLRRRVRESPAMEDWRAPALSMGEKGSVLSSVPPHFLSLLIPKPARSSPKNPSRHRRISPDPDRFRPRLLSPATALAPLELLYTAGPTTMASSSIPTSTLSRCAAATTTLVGSSSATMATRTACEEHPGGARDVQPRIPHRRQSNRRGGQVDGSTSFLSQPRWPLLLSSMVLACLATGLVGI
jgi:hypothetical protein